MTLLFVKEIERNNEEYAKKMRVVLNPEMAFYKTFKQKHIDDFSLVNFIVNF